MHFQILLALMLVPLPWRTPGRTPASWGRRDTPSHAAHVGNARGERKGPTKQPLPYVPSQVPRHPCQIFLLFLFFPFFLFPTPQHFSSFPIQTSGAKRLTRLTTKCLSPKVGTRRWRKTDRHPLASLLTYGSGSRGAARPATPWRA
jgi:hypothetical protein